MTLPQRENTANGLSISDRGVIVLITLTRYSVRHRPSGTSPTLNVKTVLPVAFLS